MEVINREIEAILIKIVALYRKGRASRLQESVWAYRTTWFTPFKLVYGVKVGMTIEFEHNTLRKTMHLGLSLIKGQQERIRQLKSLDQYRKESLQSMEMVLTQIIKWYDQNINIK